MFAIFSVERVDKLFGYSGKSSLTSYKLVNQGHCSRILGPFKSVGTSLGFFFLPSSAKTGLFEGENNQVGWGWAKPRL